MFACHNCGAINKIVAVAPTMSALDPADVPTHDLIERFIRSVEFTNECWLWTKALDRHGYGKFRAENRDRLAHRWGFEQFVGSIPEGLDLDHLCRVRRCVRPEHLEPVTRSENVRRSRV